MTDERWATVWELFHSVREAPAEQCSAILASATIDRDIRDEVMALL